MAIIVPQMETTELAMQGATQDTTQGATQDTMQVRRKDLTQALTDGEILKAEVLKDDGEILNAKSLVGISMSNVGISS